jgi:hypothetical protein
LATVLATFWKIWAIFSQFSDVSLTEEKHFQLLLDYFQQKNVGVFRN